MISQKERVYRMLLAGPVCGTTLLNEHIPRYAARISELRRTGLNIDTRECSRHLHQHRTKQIEYVLIPPDRLFV